ncbi:Uncharacterised protein [Vibrio cholerae]|nr:Uncharacterised protein [Vibrio cholerae]
MVGQPVRTTAYFPKVILSATAVDCYSELLFVKGYRSIGVFSV